MGSVKAKRSGSVAFARLNSTQKTGPGGNMYLKIYIDGDTTIIKAQPQQRLIELLPTIHTFIQKKKGYQKTNSLDPQKYYYFYFEGTEPLNMTMKVEALRQKELELRLKVRPVFRQTS